MSTNASLAFESHRGPRIDPSQFEHFLRMLDPNARWFTFQTFTDGEQKPQPDQLAKVFNLSRFTRGVLDLYEQGAGVWVTINDSDGNGRKASAVTRVRAVWQEDDDGFEGEFPLEPSLVVETSPGHFHRYWLASDDWPADEQGRKDFAGVMACMVAAYGSDKGAKDISRVLRVPGFLHRKNLAEPYMVRIVGGNRRRYTHAQIMEAFTPPQKTSGPSGNGHAGTGHSESHAELVRQILTGENYHGALASLAWRHIGAGMPAGQVVEQLRGIMRSIPNERRDERWHARFAEIPRLVSSAQEKCEKHADDQNKATNVKAWPFMESKAMHGIAGRIARLATENSEADPVAVVATALAYAAAEFGRSQFSRVGDTVHHSRHFNAIVGKSSRGRKGTSYDPVERFFKRAEVIRTNKSSLPFPSGCKLKISNGPLSSGEGLVFAVRDGDDEEDGDPGVQDKRLLVVEEELGAALRAFQRSGNNLSMIMRRAFDGKTIEPLTKNDRLVATNPHISIVGHITRPELNSLLNGTEVWNGFGNRFQWLMSRRSKVVPFPEPMPDEKVEEIAQELARVIELAHRRGEKGGHELVLSNSAHDHWANVYPELTRDYPGILGAVTSRQEAHARRLALTYAQLDGAERIEIDHLEAALAFCRYAFDSAAYLFGETELNPIAQKIIEALTAAKGKGLKGMTQTEIMALFHRNMKAEDLAAVLEDLQERGRITLTKVKTGERGRSPSLWSINERNETNEGNAN